MYLYLLELLCNKTFPKTQVEMSKVSAKLINIPIVSKWLEYKSYLMAQSRSGGSFYVIYL